MDNTSPKQQVRPNSQRIEVEAMALCLENRAELLRDLGEFPQTAEEMDKAAAMLRSLQQQAASPINAAAAHGEVEFDETAALEDFGSWFAENYHDGVILSKPAWHMPKIFRAAVRAIKAASRQK